jgi:endonuclease YncB( thermonuclease family)
MKYLIYVLLLVCCTADATLSGRVVKVTDGDTITILTAGNKQEKIRLIDIDAPEKGQDYCNRSQEYLASMVAGKTVTVEYKGRDRYRRILGTVYVEGKNVNEEMVRAGLAWEYYLTKNRKIKALQEEAQRKRLNIWSMPNPVSPREYRQSKKEKK